MIRAAFGFGLALLLSSATAAVAADAPIANDAPTLGDWDAARNSTDGCIARKFVIYKKPSDMSCPAIVEAPIRPALKGKLRIETTQGYKAKGEDVCCYDWTQTGNR